MNLQCPSCKGTSIEQIDYDRELGMTVVECQDCGHTGCIDQFQSKGETMKEKYLVIRHDGNGGIRPDGITVEELNPEDFEEQMGDEYIVCIIPIKDIPKEVSKTLSEAH